MRRAAGEGAKAFAARALHLENVDFHVTASRWNGEEVIFVDYEHETGGEDGGGPMTDREVVALISGPGAVWRQVQVTTGEWEGGPASVTAIGFANADHDKAQELIVMLTWPVQHYDVRGTSYEVRLLDDAEPGQTSLTYLKGASRLFAKNACDCWRRDEPAEHFGFKTIAAVKRGLKRAGY